MKKSKFGTLVDGQAVDAIVITNENGMEVELLTLGATIRRWTIGNEENTDIVLGFDSLEGYVADQGYLGRTVGRYANRIESGQFFIDSNSYKVSTNLQGNSLHGGVNGFHNRVWTVANDTTSSPNSVTLAIQSEDGDQGFPGTLTMTVTFTLDDENCLTITYEATSDKDTVFNPTQHTYFNIAGHNTGTVHAHQLQLNAAHYTPANDEAIPNGEIRPTLNTVFDFSEPRSFASAIGADDPEIKAANGLDHNWCVDGYLHNNATLQLVAIAHDPDSGRQLVTRTTMPGIQVYSGNFIGENTLGKSNAVYGPYHGFCIESQFYPNSPNEAHFPSPVLRANTPFKSVTSYQVVL